MDERCRYFSVLPLCHRKDTIKKRKFFRAESQFVRGNPFHKSPAMGEAAEGVQNVGM
jgi:hypothetical protein